MLNSMIRNAFVVVLGCTVAACGGGGGKKSTPASSVAVASSKAVASSVTPSSAASVAPSSAAFSTVAIKDVAPAGLPIGVALKSGYLSGTTNHDIVEKHFNEIELENDMKMSYLQTGNDVFSFANADSYATYAAAQGMGFHGHVLVWHSDYQIPSVMKSFSGSAAGYQALLTNHVTKVAENFAGKIKSWDVVNEALGDNSTYRTDSMHYVKTGNSIDFIAQAFKDARAVDQLADLYYADYSIEANGTKTTNLINLLGILKTANAPVTGVSFQMHINQNGPSIASLKAAWKKVVDLGLKVKITELDIPLNNGYCGTGNCFTVLQFTPIIAAAQGKRYCEVVEAYLKTVPEAQRGGISVWGVRDSESWLLQQNEWSGYSDWPLLFDDAGAEKPAVEGVRAALQGQPCI